MGRSSPQPRSPLHPKALTPRELARLQRGTPLVLASYSWEIGELERMDSIRVIGLVKLFIGRTPVYDRSTHVVLDDAPRHLKKSVRYGEYHQLGTGGMVGLDIETFGVSRPTNETRLDHGYAFRASDLGLTPRPRGRWREYKSDDPEVIARGRWARFCLIEPSDM